MERQLVRYDKRGTGLSDRNVGDYSLDAQVRDLEAVVEQPQSGRVALLACCQGGPIAIRYAVLHPENVRALILYGTYHSGKRWRGDEPGVAAAFASLIRADWARYGSSALTDIVVPGAPPEVRELAVEYQRQSATAEDAACALGAMLEYEVTPLLAQVTTPTLVLHRRKDRGPPFQQGREIASRIPAARFAPLEGNIHVIWLGDTQPLVTAINGFLSGFDEPQPRSLVHEGLQSVLFTDIEGSTTLTQRLGDAKSQEVLRVHNVVVREALKAHAGTEIKHTGDGIMASFPLASRALECAVGIQRALAAHNEEHPDTPIRVRIGLNAGEPVAEEEDLFGTAVQVAARICAHAEPCQILASNVVQELAAGKGFAFSDEGEAALKGLEKPVHLYEVGWEE
jgi:class 3 adenylate cyclase/pimeloyl-ACP methyl ester carboxylesterase